MQLRIISLNLAGFKDWESRQQSIIDFIDEQNPDILLLQEVKFDPVYSVHGQSVLINQLLNSPFPFSQTTISKFYQPSSSPAFREGLAVLSRFPIANSEALVLTKQVDDKHPRIVQNIDIVVDGRQILLSNIHLSNNKYSVEQLGEFLGILRSRGEERIIAGDFNIFNLEESSELYSKDYTASTEFKKYISFPAEGHTFDYVLIPKDVILELLETREGLSDHSALQFTLRLSES